MLFYKLRKANDEINELYQHQGYTIALLGNPNVGKSSVFNVMTGMKQHTGNWPGKTVELATGVFSYRNQLHHIVDLPGIYSLLTHSSEEEVSRDFICFEDCDVCVVVCDATMLERNLNLALQVMEITDHVVIAVNMMDEAKKKNISIDLDALSSLLQVRVVGISARNRDGFEELKDAIMQTACKKESKKNVVEYPELEKSIQRIIQNIHTTFMNKRFLALKLLDSQVHTERFYRYILNMDEIIDIVNEEKQKLQKRGIYDRFEEIVVNALQQKAYEISEKCIIIHDNKYLDKDMKLDRIVTHKIWGYGLMLILLAIIFWITIQGANIPSDLLSNMFMHIEIWLHEQCAYFHVNPFFEGIFIDGMVKISGWVISVMLPPMAIFFPMFTLLEDFGYLPRVAFNLDGFFQKANTCGKQALTMAMGFGCNAVGVSGARIMNSPRERLIAILTNTFMPCNGRFPMLISIVTMFFSGIFINPWNGVFSSIILTVIILFSVMLTLGISRLLSNTILKGIPSSFTLELPPYRKPEVKKVIIRSIFDRTLFVLGRAVSVAIPAGIVIWLLGNIEFHNLTLLMHISNFLDPLARLMGLDGVILLAFILGFPANEIVVPIMIMIYMSNSTIMEISDLTVLKSLFIDNGWTWITAICTLVFAIAHFPCATTTLTIKKETQSWKWTCISFLLPTIVGIVLCIGIHVGIDLILLLFHL